MFEIIFYIIVVIFVAMWCYSKWQKRPFEKLAAIMPGPTSYPIIGVGYQFIGSTTERKKNNILFLKKYNVTSMYIFVIFFRDHEHSNWICERL